MASFTYDSSGTPTSVTVGNNPQTAPRYYYVYNGHGDVVSLVDGGGNLVASYTYDEFGTITASSENLPGGWTNSYRYYGRDLVRYDSETSLDWMSVRAYDPTLGRFISRDPPGRVPLMGWTSQPYAYAGNNPLVNVDPSGQRLVGASGAVTETAGQQKAAYQHYYRVIPVHPKCSTLSACEKVKNSAIGNLIGQRNFDLAAGAILILVTDALRAWIDRNSLKKEVADFINLCVLLSQTLPAIASVLFGGNSPITRMLRGVAKVANYAVGVLRGIQSAIAGWGFLSWAASKAWGLITHATDALSGGLGYITQVAVELLGQTVVDGAAAYAYVFLQRGQQEADEVDRWATESTQYWCTVSMPGACGHVQNWNA